MPEEGRADHRSCPEVVLQIEVVGGLVAWQFDLNQALGRDPSP